MKLSFQRARIICSRQELFTRSRRFNCKFRTRGLQVLRNAGYWETLRRGRWRNRSDTLFGTRDSRAGADARIRVDSGGGLPRTPRTYEKGRVAGTVVSSVTAPTGPCTSTSASRRPTRVRRATVSECVRSIRGDDSRMWTPSRTRRGARNVVRCAWDISFYFPANRTREYSAREREHPSNVCRVKNSRRIQKRSSQIELNSSNQMS